MPVSDCLLACLSACLCMCARVRVRVRARVFTCERCAMCRFGRTTNGSADGIASMARASRAPPQMPVKNLKSTLCSDMYMLNVLWHWLFQHFVRRCKHRRRAWRASVCVRCGLDRPQLRHAQYDDMAFPSAQLAHHVFCAGQRGQGRRTSRRWSGR